MIPEPVDDVAVTEQIAARLLPPAITSDLPPVPAAHEPAAENVSAPAVQESTAGNVSPPPPPRTSELEGRIARFEEALYWATHTQQYVGQTVATYIGNVDSYGTYSWQARSSQPALRWTAGLPPSSVVQWADCSSPAHGPTSAENRDAGSVVILYDASDVEP